jgi:hypothetical protein
MIPNQRIREAIIRQALSADGQRYLRAYNGRTVVEDERGFVTVITGDGRAVTTPPPSPVADELAEDPPAALAEHEAVARGDPEPPGATAPDPPSDACVGHRSVRGGVAAGIGFDTGMGNTLRALGMIACARRSRDPVVLVPKSGGGYDVIPVPTSTAGRYDR